MSSEDQDLVQALAPVPLPSLPSLVENPPVAVQWPRLSQNDSLSQQSHGASGPPYFSDSQFDNMGQGVGMQLPPVDPLVLPPQVPVQTAQPAPLMGRLPAGAMQVFNPSGFILDGGVPLLPGTGPGRHPSVCKAEHKNSRAARRGPMDEMRQLVRILVKLMPDSSRFLTVPDEGGGGNRVKEEHIKDYLNKVLGRSHDLSDEAPPYPEWGLGNGWAAYLSQLFTWARGVTITPDQALRCARRLPGRSWETLSDELEKLRLCPAAWPLPLRKQTVREVQKRYEETGQMPPPAPRPLPAAQQTAVMVQAVMMAAAGSAPAAPAAVPLAAAGPALVPEGTVAMEAVVEQAAKEAAEQLLKRPLAASSSEVAGQQPDQPMQAQAATAVTAAAQPGPAVQAVLPVSAPGGIAAPASYYQGPPGPAPKRRRKTAGVNLLDINFADHSELEIWYLLLKITGEAREKYNSTPAEKTGDLEYVRLRVQRSINEMCGGGTGAGGGGCTAAAAALNMAGVAVGPPPGLTALAAGYVTQQAAAAAGQHPAVPSGPPTQPAQPAAAASSSVIDAAAQLKARLGLNMNMGLLHGAMAGAQGTLLLQQAAGHSLSNWSRSAAAAPQPQALAGAQLAGQPHQQGAAVPAPGQVQVQVARPVNPQASLSTVQQQPAAQQHMMENGQRAAPAAPPQHQVQPQQQQQQASPHQTPQQQQQVPQPQPQQPAPQPQQQAQSQPPPQQQQQPPPSQQQQQQQQQPQQPSRPPNPPAPPPPHQQQPASQVTAHANHGPAGGQPAGGSGGAAGGMTASGAGVFKPTVVAAPEAVALKLPASKESSKDTTAKTADLRLGSVCGAFKSYDKVGGGLEALVAAAAAAAKEDGEGEGGPQSPKASQAQPSVQQPRNHSDAGPGRGGSGGGGSGEKESSLRHDRAPEKAESKLVVQAATITQEEMDETETRHRCHSEPVVEMQDCQLAHAQPANSCAPPRKSVNELRKKVHMVMDQAALNVEERHQHSQHQHQQSTQEHHHQHEEQRPHHQQQNSQQQQQQPGQAHNGQHSSQLRTAQQPSPQPPAQQQQQQPQPQQQQQQQPGSQVPPSGSHPGNPNGGTATSTSPPAVIAAQTMATSAAHPANIPTQGLLFWVQQSSPMGNMYTAAGSEAIAAAMAGGRGQILQLPMGAQIIQPQLLAAAPPPPAQLVLMGSSPAYATSQGQTLVQLLPQQPGPGLQLMSGSIVTTQQ